MKVVINRCYGGFGLSAAGSIALMKRNPALVQEWEDPDERSADYISFAHEGKRYFYADRDVPRNDPDLIAVIEELGAEANSRYADLHIVEIPDDADWYIAEYDGYEHVAENHRTWH